MPVLAIISRNVFCCFKISTVASSSHTSANIAEGVERSGAAVCQHKASRRGNYAGGLATVRGVLLWVRRRDTQASERRRKTRRTGCVSCRVRFCGFKKRRKVVIVVVVFSLLNS